jgi:hypothetical protein
VLVLHFVVAFVAVVLSHGLAFVVGIVVAADDNCHAVVGGDFVN